MIIQIICLVFWATAAYFRRPKSMETVGISFCRLLQLLTLHKNAPGFDCYLKAPST